MNRNLLYLLAIIRHPLRAVSALFWRLTGKKKRAYNRFGALVVSVTHRYDLWRQQSEDLSSHAQRQLLQQLDALLNAPMIGVVVVGDDTIQKPSALTQKSLDGQWVKKFIRIGGDADIAKVDYILWLREGDQLSPDALARFAIAIVESDHPDILYSDEDQIPARRPLRRSYPYFKPDWNPELLIACDYIGGACAVKVETMTAITMQSPRLSWAGRYEILLKLATIIGTDLKACHLPHILYHRTFDKMGVHNLLPSKAMEKALKNWREDACPEASLARDTFGFLWLDRALPASPPTVSIIIPTRDMLSILKTCITSVLELTAYENFEIIIMDNDSQKAETKNYFVNISQNSKVRVINYPHAFNYSAINNEAAKKAKGSYLCLLNNDTKVISSNWLSVMMAQALRKGVGAVGAKLLYPDNRIQHAGVVTGIGQLAGHGHRMIKDDHPGYFYHAHLSQQVSAVTAACLVVSKRKYMEVGGLDEEQLTVAFNDVDFCLKLDKAGYKNIYAPQARLYHYESQSRGKDMKGEKRKRYLREVAVMQERWQTDKQMDRFYSPNLTVEREDFSIKVELDRMSWGKMK